MNLSSFPQNAYENFTPLAGYKNKPNSNPNKPNFQKAKMNINLYFIEHYRKNDDFTVRINKPNFRNGQNERKLNFNKGLHKKRLFSRPKNKPNSNPIKACPERSRMGQFLQRPKSLAGKSGHTPPLTQSGNCLTQSCFINIIYRLLTRLLLILGQPNENHP